MATETVEGAAIRFDPASTGSTSALALNESPLAVASRHRASLRGAAIGFALIALAGAAGLLFTLAAFGYSIGELL